jgi:hypothetical protein
VRGIVSGAKIITCPVPGIVVADTLASRVRTIRKAIKVKTVSTILASLISVIAFLGCEKSETSGLPEKAIQSATPGKAGTFDQEESDAKELLSQHGAGVVESTPTGAARIIVFSVRKFSDLTPVGPALEKLKSLESIHLDYTGVHDLTPLTSLKNLKILRVNSTQVVDLKPLAGLTNLESLNLDNTAVNDVAPRHENDDSEKALHEPDQSQQRTV